MAETETPTHLGVRDRWITTGLLGIGLIVFAINGSTTNLMLAKIMTNLRVELYQIHWVITAFGIARTVAIPTMGWLSGRIGTRTLYLCSIGTFCLGTLGSAVAWDWPSLIAFRILAGAGGGFIPPLSMAIFYQIFPPGQRGMALGFSLMGWSIGPSIGPLMGGYLVQFASWRVVYMMLLPLVGTGFVLAWLFLPPLNRPQRRQLDLFGLISMAIGVSTLILALSQANREGWDSSYIRSLFAIALFTLIVFVITELRRDQPLVELRLLRHPPFIMAMLVLMITTTALRSTGPMIPVLMQRLLGFEPLLVAWTLLPANILYGCVVLLAGRLSDRMSPQYLVLAGLCVYASAFGYFSGISEMTTALTMTAFMCCRFIAEGLIVAPNNLTALRALPESQVMMAAGLMGLLRSVSNVMGASSAAVVWDTRFGRHLLAFAEGSPADALGLTQTMREVQNFLVWSGEIAALVPAKTAALMQQRLVAEATTAAWQDYILYNALFTALAIIPASLVSNHIWRRSKAAVKTPEEAPGVAQPSG